MAKSFGFGFGESVRKSKHSARASRKSRRASFEKLEDRRVLSGISPITAPAPIAIGAPVLVPITDTSASPGTFTATSTNANVVATVLTTSTLLKMQVTGYGEMDFLLLNTVAPNNIARVTSLANAGFYNGKDIFRVIQNFMFQSGSPTNNGLGGSGGAPVNDEFSGNIQFTTSGILAMANSGPNTNDSQFFVTAAPYSFGNNTYTIIGDLIAGDSVRAAIMNTPVTTNPSSGEDSLPITEPVISSMSVVTNTQSALVLVNAKTGASGSSQITIKAANGDTQSFVAAVATPQAPATPVLTSSFAGYTNLNNSSPAKEPQFTVSGLETLPAGDTAQVAIYADGTQIGQAAASGSSVVITANGATTLTDGAHSITAVETITYPASQGVPGGTITSAASSAETIGVGSTAPQITSTFSGAATPGLTMNYQVKTNVDTVPNEHLTYTLVTAPAGMAISASGKISWNPPIGTTSPQSVDVRVAEPFGKFSDQAFSVALNAPVAPTIKSTSLKNAVVGQLYSYQLAATGAPGQTFKFGLGTVPSGMTMTTSGLVTWTPTASQAGSQSATFTVTDQFQDVGNQQVTITVAPASPLKITSTPATTATVGQAFTYNVTTSDTAGLTLTYGSYAATSAPSGFGFAANASSGNPANHASWTPSTGGPQTIEIKVTDSAGNSAVQDFTLQVAEATPLQITSAAPTSATVGEFLSYQVVTNAAAGQTPSFSLPTAPAGMSISSGGLITWLPSSAGAQSVDVHVTDLPGQDSTDQQFTLQATDSATLRITSTPTPSATVGGVYSYQVATIGAAGQTVTYSLPTSPSGMTIGTSGLISWTPTSSQTGGQSVDVHVTDTSNDSYDQSFTVQASALQITSSPVLAAVVNQPYSYQLTTNAATGQGLTYSFLSAPSGMSVSTSGLITWTAGTAGPQAVDVKIGDSKGDTNDQQFTIQVGTSSAPAITSSPILSGIVGQLYSYQVTASGAGQTFTYSLITPPPGMQISSSGLLTWTPSAAGIQTVDIRVSDTSGDQLDQEFNINVTSSASTVQVTSTPVTQAAVGLPYSYQVTTNAASGSLISYSLSGAPTGMSIDSSGLITWTPSGTSPQSIDVHVSVLSQGSADQPFTIQMVPLSPPTFTSAGPTSAVVGQPYTYHAQATGIQGQIITYSFVTHPSGMTIDGVTGQIAWTPTASQTGSNPVVVTAMDQEGNGINQSFNIQVTALAITSTANTGALVAGQSYTYQVVAVGPVGETLTYSLPVMPAGMTISATGLIQWTPPTAQSPQVQVRVADTSGDAVTQSFTLSVSGFTPPTITSTAGTQASVGNAYSYQVAATDSFGLDVTYSLGAAPAGMTMSNSGLVTWSPLFTEQGTQTFVVRASDPFGDSSSQTVTVQVAAIPGPTFTSTAPTQADVGHTYTYQVTTSTFNKGVGFAQDVSYQFFDVSPPTGMSLNSLTGAITWSPTASQVGSQNVEIAAVDQNNNFTSQSFTITVFDFGDPTFTSTAVTSATAGQAYTYNVKTQAVSGQTITYSLATSPSGMTINGSTGAIAWTPSAIGPQSVDVKATDQFGNSKDQTFTVQVGQATSISITSTAPKVADVGHAYSYQIVTNAISGQTVTFSPVGTLPSGMNVSATGLVTWTPTASQVGAASAQVKAADQLGHTFTQSLAISVVNLAKPAFTSTPITTAAVSALYSYQTKTNAPATQAVTFSLVSGPSGMTITPGGLLTWTPGTATSSSVDIRATDQFGNASDQTFTVQSVAFTTPAVTSIAPAAANVGQMFTYQVTTNAISGQTITYSLFVAPTGMTINASTGLITWTPTATQTGSNAVTVHVADQQGNTGQQGFNIAVGTLPAPTFTSTPATQAAVGQTYTYKSQASSQAGQTLTYSLTSPPTGMTINASGVVSWTPTTAVASQAVDIHVVDQSGGSADQDFNIKVAAAPAAGNANPVVQLSDVVDGNAAILVLNGANLELIQNATGASLFSAPIAGLQSMTIIDANGETDFVGVDFSAGGPFTLPHGLAVRGGTNPGQDLVAFRSAGGNTTFALNGNRVAMGNLQAVFANQANLEFFGGAGNDTYKLSSSSTATTVNDPSGANTLDFSGATGGIKFNLGMNNLQPQTIAPWNTTLAITGVFQDLVGTNFADTLTAGSANAIIRSGLGNDTMVGGSGNDVLIGGGGNDTIRGGTAANLLIAGGGTSSLYGGAGNNTFVGGTTSFDANDQALLSLVQNQSAAVFTSYWTYRRALLDGAASGALLLSGATIQDHGAFNQIFGAGGKDMFMPGANGIIRSR